MTTKIKTILLFTGLIIAMGFAGGLDKADAFDTSEARPISVSPSLEAVADSYWEVRGVTPAPKAIVFESGNDPETWAWADEGGDRIWLTEDMLSRWDIASRMDICIAYIHERGHNAGLTHESGWQIMNPVTEYSVVPHKCSKWVIDQWEDWKQI
jgi:hypothetical protein